MLVCLGHAQACAVDLSASQGQEVVITQQGVATRPGSCGAHGAHRCAGTLSALVMIAQREGIGALYAGVWLTWLKQAPQYAVTFLCYDLAKAWLAAENGNGKHLTDAQPGILAQQKPNAPFSLPTSR